MSVFWIEMPMDGLEAVVSLSVRGIRNPTIIGHPFNHAFTSATCNGHWPQAQSKLKLKLVADGRLRSLDLCKGKQESFTLELHLVHAETQELPALN